MEILHFNWLPFKRSINNAVVVVVVAAAAAAAAAATAAKFGGFSIVNIFQLTLAPFAFKGHGSIAHSSSPHGLLTCSPQGLRV